MLALSVPYEIKTSAKRSKLALSSKIQKTFFPAK